MLKTSFVRQVSLEQSDAQAADFEAIDKAVLEIEKQAGNLADVETWTKTIQSNSKKILSRIDNSRQSLDRQVETLREKLAELKSLTAEEAPTGT